jgi:hypothetical protein
MKKTIILTAFLVFLQGCQVYKPVTVDSIQPGKTYEITHKNGQQFVAKCLENQRERIAITVNENMMHLPKSDIQYVQKQTVSLFRLAAGITVTSAAIILLVDNAKKPGMPYQISN